MKLGGLGNEFPDGNEPKYRLRRDVDFPLGRVDDSFGAAVLTSGLYTITLSWASVVVVGLGSAIEDGGTAHSALALGSKSLVVVGKMGPPGNGVSVLLGLREATPVLITLVFIPLGRIIHLASNINSPSTMLFSC